MLRFVVAVTFALAAVTSAQLTPEQQARLAALLKESENAELAALLADSGEGGAAAIESKNQAEKDLLALEALVPVQVRTTADGVATRVKPGQDAVFSRLRKQEVSVFEIEKALGELSKAFDAAIGSQEIQAVISSAVNHSMSTDAVLLGLVGDQTELKISTTKAVDKAGKDRDADVAAMSDEYTSTLNAVEKQLSDESKARASSDDALDKKLSDFDKVTTEKLKKVDDVAKQVDTAIKTSLKPVTDGIGILARIKLTYMGDPKVPVYRWNWWHTHQHGSTSWFDGNNVRGFGGEHPSHWTDGNARADRMNADVKYLKRFFPRKGTGVNFGATVCSDTFIMHSSTTGRMCGVLFRIKNTGTSSTTWRPEWFYTSWHGWSETASISLNGANNFNSNCGHSYCRHTHSLNIPANGQRNRISTVVFISSGTGAYGVSYGNHERANINMFNNLQLPNGLEYVDDLDTMTGSWKQ